MRDTTILRLASATSQSRRTALPDLDQGGLLVFAPAQSLTYKSLRTQRRVAL